MKRLKLLILTRDFSKYVERNTHYLSIELMKHTDLIMWHHAGDIHEILTQITERPNFILMNEDIYPYMTGLSSLTIPFGIIMYDIHHLIEERTQFIRDNKIKHIFSHYRDKFHEWYPEFSKRMLWLPLFVNTEIFQDYGLPREIDWLLMGKTGWGFYPLRNNMLQEMKEKPGFVHHEHPGYRNFSDDENEKVFVGEKYAREINRAKMFLTCGLIYNYPIIKYYEVLACKTLLLAPSSTELTDLGFIPNVHFVAIDEFNFMEKAEYYLTHEHERELIAEQGYHMVHSRHSSAIRAAELVRMIEEIVSKEMKI